MNLPESFIKEINSYNSTLLDGLVEALSTTQPSVSVRANRYKNIDVPTDASKVKWCERGWYLPARKSFTFDPAMHQGLYYVQDASSMIITHAVSQLCGSTPRPLCYLDACAAPGGKTTAAIDVLPTGSLVVANEYVYGRASVLAENITKWGYHSAVVSRGDTSRISRLKSFFDIIAADVPCSGEGMFRKDVEAVAQWSSSLVAECVARQREIIRNLWSALRPGGYFIYSTCTFNRSENEEMVAMLVDEYGAESVEIEMLDEWNIAPGIDTPHHCYRFMPHRVNGEGLFMAVVRKSGEYTERKIKPTKEKRKPTPIDNTLKKWINNSNFELASDDDKVVAIAKQWKDEVTMLKSHLDVVNCGVTIATIKGRDYIPTQSLAMSILLNIEAFAHADVDYQIAISFLRREAITINDAPRGYLLLTYKNRPLGFVKNLGNRANNLYPQDWRILSSHIPDETPHILD